MLKAIADKEKVEGLTNNQIITIYAQWKALVPFTVDSSIFEDCEVPAETLRAALEAGTVEALLRRVPVRRGDGFYIPAGTIHAIGSGILLAEVQQNSNLTYRLYDYGRLGKDGRPRPLHVDKALAVSDLSGAQAPRQPLRVLRYRPGFAKETLCECPYFEVARCLLNSEAVELPALPESYRVLLCVDGAGSLDELQFRKGDTVFIPATCGALTLSGSAEFLLIRG